MPQIGFFGAAGLAMLLALASGTPVQGQDAPAGPPAGAAEPHAAPVQHDPGEMAGIWDYNPDESINIQTGRPEQSPRSATQRGGIVPGGDVGQGAGSRPRVVPDDIDRWGRPSRRGGYSGIGPTPAMQREARDLARDLLEIPEALTISVSDEAVSFVDDLDREFVYLTDGREQEQQIAASRFDVRTTWNNGQLRKEIKGGFDFKMTETYFLSPDANRLFVIIRVGEPDEDRPQAGFNRVYDRVDSQP